MEVWKDSRIVYDGRIVRVRVGEVELDNGATAMREVIEHPGGVCVAPYTGRGVVLVRQFRIALGEYVLEVPAGKLEPGDDPAGRAARELEEETGCVARTLEPAGFVYATVGYCSERIHFFLGLDLEKTHQRLEEEERIELVEMPLDEVRRGLAGNTFTDSKTVIALERLLRHIDRA